MKITMLALAAMLTVGCFTPVVLAAQSDARLVLGAADTDMTVDKRSKPRVPGGSGCDDPEDLVEHPECQG